MIDQEVISLFCREGATVQVLDVIDQEVKHLSIGVLFFIVFTHKVRCFVSASRAQNLCDMSYFNCVGHDTPTRANYKTAASDEGIAESGK